MKAPLLALALACGPTLAACDRSDPPDTANQAAAAGTKRSVVDALGGADNLGATAKLVKSAGLDHALSGIGNYTIFAPVDTAFAGLPAAQRATLESKDGRPQLIALLGQHIVTGYVVPADLDAAFARKGGVVTLAAIGSGKPLTLHREGSVVTIGTGASAPHVVGDPIVARNGVIYPIDRVIPDGA